MWKNLRNRTIFHTYYPDAVELQALRCVAGVIVDFGDFSRPPFGRGIAEEIWKSGVRTVDLEKKKESLKHRHRSVLLLKCCD